MEFKALLGIALLLAHGKSSFLKSLFMLFVSWRWFCSKLSVMLSRKDFNSVVRQGNK